MSIHLPHIRHIGQRARAIPLTPALSTPTTQSKNAAKTAKDVVDLTHKKSDATQKLLVPAAAGLVTPQTPQTSPIGLEPLRHVIHSENVRKRIRANSVESPLAQLSRRRKLSEQQRAR